MTQNERSWTAAKLRAVRALTPTVRELEIEPAGGALPWTPGSHLNVAIGSGEPVASRSYSLIGEPDGECYRIAVKLLANSRGGSRFMHALAVGSALKVGRPENSFMLGHNVEDYLLVAAGIGITPLISMATALKRRGVRVKLVYGVRSEHELAYRELLTSTLGADLHLHCSSHGQRIDPDRELAELPASAEAYVCGPPSLLADMRAAWTRAKREPTRLRFETFGAAGVRAPKSFRVRLPRHNLDLVVAKDESLLDALLGAGIEVLHDCRRGECGLCIMDVEHVDGVLDHRDVFLSPGQQQQGRKLCVCVSRAVGSVVLDSAFRPD